MKRRERALELVQSARDAKRESGSMLVRARTLRADGEALLEGVPSWGPGEDKHRGWALTDEAAALEQRRRLEILDATQKLHAALTYVPELPEAHQALAEHYRDQHRDAERGRDHERARGE